MKFKITATSVWLSTDVIVKYPCLMKFGYEMVTEHVPSKCMIRDEFGKPIEFVNGERTFNTPFIHINTIEQLMELINAVENDEYFSCGVVVSMNDGIPEIEIYDSYRE